MKVKLIQKLWDERRKEYSQVAVDHLSTKPGQLFTLSKIRLHGIMVEEWGHGLEITTYTHPDDLTVPGK